MPDCAAPRCDRPTPDVAYVCPGCERDLAAALHDAAALWPELETTITGQARMAPPGPRPRGRTPPHPIRPGGDKIGPVCQRCAHTSCVAIRTPDYATGAPNGLPFNWTASLVREDVRNEVTTWARHILEERGGDPPADTPGLMRWLAEQLRWARYQKWAGDLWDELGYACSRIGPAVDRPRPRVDAGPCLAPTPGGHCQQRLAAGPRAVIIHCPACRTTHTAQQRTETIMAAATDIRLTAEEAADLLTLHGWPTQSATVRQWGGRRRALAVAGRYRFGDVRDLRLAMDQRMSRSTA